MTRAMKDSGIEWIGQIPEDWKIRKIGDYFSQRMTKVSDKEYKPLSVTKKGIVLQLDTAAKSDNHENRKLVLKGDFVINSRSDRKLSSGLSDLDGSVSLINIVIFSETVSKRYTNYLLKNMAFAEEFYRWGTGIVSDLWSTKWDKMKKILIPIPSLEEQEQIASILDKKVERIDAIIADTKQSIEELKKYKQSLITETVTKGLDKNVPMKNSGIEWIGQIPENWGLKRIGFFFNKVKTPNKNLIEKNLLSLSYGNIIQKNIDTNEGLLPKSFETYNIVLPGDIVLRMTDLQNDHKSLRTGFVGEKGIITSAYITLRVKNSNKINSKYIQQLLHAFDIKKGFYSMGSGVRQGVTFSDIKKIDIVVPSLAEQKEIIEFLDNQTKKIDQLIQDKEVLITQYEEYKKSIIYEYVTGKREI